MAAERTDFSGEIELTLAATKTAGNPDKVQDMVGVYRKSGVSGDKVPFAINGVITVAKQAGTGLGWTKGQKLYYRSGGPDLTTAATSNTYAGIAYADATATATTGQCIMGHGVD